MSLCGYNVNNNNTTEVVGEINNLFKYQDWQIARIMIMIMTK